MVKTHLKQLEILQNKIRNIAYTLLLLLLLLEKQSLSWQ